MNSSDLDRLRFLLAGLREPAPAEEAERQALATFERELGGKAGRAEDRGRPRLKDRS